MARVGLKNAKFNQIDYTTKKYKALAGTPAVVPSLINIIDEKFAPEYNTAELYADDVLAESDYSFKKGTLSITLADDDDTVMATLMGNEIDDGLVGKSINDVAGEFGYGHIVTKLVGGAKKYKVEFFPRVKFTKVTTDNKTRGESVEFGTTALEGTVYPLAEAINSFDAGLWELHQTFDDLDDAKEMLDLCLTPST